MISIEPKPDDSPAPFTLRPLLDPVIEDVGFGDSQTMENQVSATFPAGTADRLPEG
jgi:hypothetical protein